MDSSKRYRNGIRIELLAHYREAEKVAQLAGDLSGAIRARKLARLTAIKPNARKGTDHAKKTATAPANQPPDTSSV